MKINLDNNVTKDKETIRSKVTLNLINVKKVKVSIEVIEVMAVVVGGIGAIKVTIIKIIVVVVKKIITRKKNHVKLVPMVKTVNKLKQLVITIIMVGKEMMVTS